jgi:tRNA nucleotidyltransferase (CCA-adding enzyme)
MKEYLKKLPKELRSLITLACNVASVNHMSVYLVGGIVRDLILGKKNLDLDIVVQGDGIKFAEAFTQKLKARLIRHRRFGTAAIILDSGLKFDIATARKEFYPQPASLPEVTNGTLKDDLFRRDFTINAMAISIGAKDFGKLIDFFGGREDILHRKIRILHNLSFIDDPTRILRAIRFEKRYNFRIESKTLSALKEAVGLKMPEIVQPQRLSNELILILKEDRPLRQIKRIQELAGFYFVNPRLSLSKKTYRLINSIEKQVRWFKKTQPRRRKLDIWLIYFMGLLDSLNINDVRAVCKRFCFPKGDEKRILTYKNFDSKYIRQLNRTQIRPSEVFKILEPLSYEVILLLKAKYNKNINLKQHIKDFLGIYNGMRLYISGADLHRLGVKPGPSYQKIFANVLNAKLNGLIRTKKEELVLIKKLVRT